MQGSSQEYYNFLYILVFRYKLSYYRFGELQTEYGKPPG